MEFCSKGFRQGPSASKLEDGYCAVPGWRPLHHGLATVSQLERTAVKVNDCTHKFLVRHWQQKRCFKASTVLDLGGSNQTVGSADSDGDVPDAKYFG